MLCIFCTFCNILICMFSMFICIFAEYFVHIILRILDLQIILHVLFYILCISENDCAYSILCIFLTYLFSYSAYFFLCKQHILYILPWYWLHILHIHYILHFTYYAYPKMAFSRVFICLFQSLFGSPSQGPAVDVPPPTSVLAVFCSITRSAWKVCWLSFGILPELSTGTWGSSPSYPPSMADTGITYNSCADALHSYTMVDWPAANQTVQQPNRVKCRICRISAIWQIYKICRICKIWRGLLWPLYSSSTET